LLTPPFKRLPDKTTFSYSASRPAHTGGKCLKKYKRKPVTDIYALNNKFFQKNQTEITV